MSDFLYLAHHGVKGQKWGVRRYQNNDGSLTDLGKRRYGGQATYKSSTIRKIVAPELRDKYSLSKLQENSARKHAQRQRAYADKRLAKTGKIDSLAEYDAQKAEKKYEAISARNANRKAYAQRMSTGKLYAQNWLLTPAGASMYRESRSRGESYIDTAAELTLPYYQLYKNKQAYGKAIMF